MNSTWVALSIAALGIAYPFWRHALRPLLPLEGLTKVLFVIWCWLDGTFFLLAAPVMRYWWAALLLGLGQLLLGTWQAWLPIQRWRQDQIIFGSPSAPLPASRLEPRRQDERAA